MDYGIDVFETLGLTHKAFCPTGEGGGIDNSCSAYDHGAETEVGITSARPWKTDEQVLSEMSGFMETMDSTPASNVRVVPGRGGWKDGHETMFATSYDGNGETRKAIIRYAKQHSQEAVLFMHKSHEGAEGAVPRSFVRFKAPLTESEVSTIEDFAVESGFSGWTWTEPGREIMFATVPKWGGTTEQHKKDADDFADLVESFDSRHARDWVISDLVEESDYDSELGD